ncbi:uncharacterized protein [Heterodontus francisci]|uniref:uncharacterized protein isoform X1 n=1 Tax=Heterodontus francisci TaxID=7792 RepID=UPI00355B5E83
MSPSPILWILAALIGINTEKLTVIQNVPRIQADEGQTVSLPCTYTANVSKLIGTYSWYKNGRKGIEVSNETAEYSGRIYSHKEDFIHTADASIQIKDVRLNDAGVYYCKVRMMQLGEEYGAGTNLTVREKTGSINGLLLILFISAPVTGGVLLIVALRCVRLCRKKDVQQIQIQKTDILEINYMADVQQTQTQEIDIPEVTSTVARLTSFPLAGVQDLNQDGNLSEPDPLCMDISQDDQSIYTPMESVKEFNDSLNNVMDAEISAIKSQNQKTARDWIQYATIQIDYLQQQPPLNAISEYDDLERDYGYEELNTTVRRDPQSQSMSMNQGNGADSYQCTGLLSECGNEDLSRSQFSGINATATPV